MTQRRTSFTVVATATATYDATPGEVGLGLEGHLPTTSSAIRDFAAAEPGGRDQYPYSSALTVPNETGSEATWQAIKRGSRDTTRRKFGSARAVDAAQ